MNGAISPQDGWVWSESEVNAAVQLQDCWFDHNPRWVQPFSCRTVYGCCVDCDVPTAADHPLLDWDALQRSEVIRAIMVMGSLCLLQQEQQKQQEQGRPRQDSGPR